MTHAHGHHNPTDGALVRTAGLTIAVAFIVMGLKFWSYAVTGSVALYSDALESIVNVVAGTAALVAIRYSTQPPDTTHNFGHHKAELFSAVLEGSLIIVAALLIFQEAYRALLAPRTFEEPALGLFINGVAAAINGGWATFLIVKGRAWRSPATVASGWHIMSDVITSVGVLAGLVLAIVTGWAILDPLLAAAVALNILWAGYHIVMESLSGLMDAAASPDIEREIHSAIRATGAGAIEAHDIRTRTAGRATFIEFHLVVPGAMRVAEAHAICDRIEADIRARLPGSEAIIHVEPDYKAKSGDAIVIGDERSGG
ncbi:MAG: cation diffusion facilitator family transporter [Hyphomicrobium sp.]|nr:cation diffusion facilitator family transporter [Hyphomicrobium sp.]